MRRDYIDTALGQWHAISDEPGNAAPLIMLNSRGRSLLPLMPLIKPTFYGIQIDVPGMAGNSFVPKPGVTMDEIGDCMAEIIDGLKLQQANFFGFHTGHKIISAFGSRHPDRVGRFILAGKTHSIVPEREARNQTMKRYIAKYPPDTQLLALEGKYVDQPEVPIGNEAVYHANFNFDLAAALTRVTAKTLVLEVVSEEEDREIGRQGEALAAYLPDGLALAVQQTEATGLALYVGTQVVADIILDFMLD